MSPGPKPAGRVRFKVIVDRIEGDLAVLELPDGGQATLPTRLLPRGLHDGAVLDVAVTLDAADEARRRAEVEELQRRLLDRS